MQRLKACYWAVRCWYQLGVVALALLVAVECATSDTGALWQRAPHFLDEKVCKPCIAWAAMSIAHKFRRITTSCCSSDLNNITIYQKKI